MQEEQWDELEGWFHRLVDVPAVERDAILRGLNQPLQARLALLLSQADRSDACLREAIAHAVAQIRRLK